ncbi:endonuclease [Cupriavidus cauae]|uniref:Endonuclease n=1 Tax=Cupriavidus cauae TaxID=2608999 RepID=A0A5M8AFJ3_9BURK|nr:endonuclease [Cupriavidus cauae]KAA6121492.1 endonuclease [Cupriavidus cauae]
MTKHHLVRTALAALAMTGSCVALAQVPGDRGAATGTSPGMAPAGQYDPANPAAAGTRDPYSSGARVGDKFDPYTQGTNQPTQQYLAPAGTQPMPMSGSYDGRMENHDTHYHDLSTLGSRVGKRSQFLDGN